MPAQTTVPPGASAFSACGTSSPAEAKMIAASSCSGGVARSPRPRSRRAAREVLGPLIAGAGEGVHLAALMNGDLADHVRCRAEAVQAEAPRVAGEPQRAVADQPAAQQRRRLLVGQSVGQRQAVALVGDGQLGEAAVDVASGEARADAQVLAAAACSSGTCRRSSRATARRRGGRPRSWRRSDGRGRLAASSPRSRGRAGEGRCGTRRTRRPSAAAVRGPGRGSGSVVGFSGWPGCSRTTARMSCHDTAYAQVASVLGATWSR